MRVAIVAGQSSPYGKTDGRDPGGPHVRIAGLAGALASDGHEVTVYARRADPGLPARAEVDGYVVEHYDAGPPAPLGEAEVAEHLGGMGRRLAECWRHRRPEVVHACTWDAGVAALAALASAGLTAPVVYDHPRLGTAAAPAYGPEESNGRGRLERALVRTAQAVITSSDSQADQLARLGVPRGRIACVPQGVDIDLFAPAPGRRRPPAGRPRVLCLDGRPDPVRGAETVLRAVARVADVELLLADGAEPGTERLVERVEAEVPGVAARLSLFGPVPRAQVPELIRSCEAVVSVPWADETGTVPLEAMACGVPVVASAVGAAAELVVDGTTGELVPPGRPDLLARRLRGLLDDPARAEAYGIAGRDRVASRHLWKRVAGDACALYRSLLDRAP
ncbi:glycosyltransferase [Allostreptomyces psammosilenae]|uniref:D-inositol 3-phosphate glycosyltransferase n=1 Tax=Allostreptomyces psammosilenae TaxID=1892865 RepID=A0A852ZNY2_9ACTN|nr:glycosyltransferase [Allostreptomyces psammosilenae]NYI04103.1 glycosyltransferase involved in cell wall biosynthesis [Allostreptomyces psammosilenae]